MKLVNFNVLNPNQSGFTGLLEDIRPNHGGKSVKRFSPAVDIYEDDLYYGVIVALPGMEKKDIKINIIDDKLGVTGERKENENAQGKIYHLQEIVKGTFSKTFHIPKDVVQEKIEAQYEEGLLKLLLPKNQKLNHKYQIEVK
ncbi:Hsp20/alpha crystallin family protein [Anditalea andensis]|uniref:SHSP domain-containing protein n=1 Tax=Anditalea andensis TaxID=1048983 RepID=A0A074LGA2_9BACT|nr:Hsp20/alpha crystallin family protein [Anditalea andensis]KEO72822.1 hypothetical protein EL17_14435 [Anditalea andensis]